ncbi:MAG: hypothetical protein ACRCYX_02360 [Dermatophilaceae bacterium]
MREAFADAEMFGWEPLEGSYGLPDPGDEHVLAVAAFAGAGAIITHNLRDFPAHLLPKGLEVLPPTEFACYTVELDPARALRAVEKISQRRREPPLPPADILENLSNRYGMTAAVEILRSQLEP